ncbi:hypothetical protein POWCR01_000230100 [Plasmodium ovale]|uniref:PIR protein n=1 Tax=Plasmodium ovale TaxID=36330 RepID=A0A1C3KKS2_PLAOA|nr:hypothetical protein POWCR01_000230100 [Plasmodium ovale]
MNFEFFCNAALKESMKNITNSIENIKERVKLYYVIYSKNMFSNIRVNSCMDLNYYISNVIYYIPKIEKNHKSSEIIKSIEQIRNDIPISLGYLEYQRLAKNV